MIKRWTKLFADCVTKERAISKGCGCACKPRPLEWQWNVMWVICRSVKVRQGVLTVNVKLCTLTLTLTFCCQLREMITNVPSITRLMKGIVMYSIRTVGEGGGNICPWKPSRTQLIPTFSSRRCLSGTFWAFNMEEKQTLLLQGDGGYLGPALLNVYTSAKFTTVQKGIVM